MSWLLKAGEANDAGAQAYLGWVYNEGTAVPRDPAVACQWWRRAAAQGHGGAQAFLGVAHHMGVGVKQDLVESGFWVLVARRNGVEMARNYWTRLERDLGPAELAAILARFDPAATRQ